MQPNPDVRRHSDGSLDFDFYRRRAARRRHLAQRLVFRHCVTLCVRAATACIQVITRPMTAVSPGYGDIRLIKPAVAAAIAVAVAAVAVAGMFVSQQALGQASHQASLSAHVMIAPSDLQWADVPSLPPGAKIAIIEGPMNEAVPFTVRLKLPANYRIPAHWHPAIEHVTVLSGTFHMGLGDKLDTTKTHVLTPGSMAIMQPKTHHFGWTSEETIVQLHGVGPWGVTYVDPADDPRKK
jgi:hypothetical protein